MKIGIVGLGLIGGSLAIDWHPHHRIIGVSRSAETIRQALEAGIIEDGGASLALLSGCEVIFICTPIDHVLSAIEALAAVVPTGTVLSDVASVKGAIVPAAEALWPTFVGGHPMAGSAAQGLAAAQARLFVGRPYVFTPTAATPKAALEVVAGLVGQLGARIYYCAAAEHDRAVARISHLPVFVSAALLANLEASGDALAAELASSGFFDTSRVGGGNPQLGTAMAAWNREALLAELHRYREQLAFFEQQIALGEWQALEQSLQRCQQVRRQIFAPPPATGDSG
ncbi:prephenate/arogenate dehydrogenase [Gloeobacter kilaueensis]|uniref:Arogenate dehydrogenase n=1 Tax=Gloeobacter kilaueensis (strain ATCC BAA-2537 / CCAP 1431/1 / ULC 316 / JS1) TaxID=1183438 RepID=U5QSI8_GLOK1|nr:prephenate/arogenate dehydrogenase [Gloeobacter kilaueensis]AGY60639.1 arogenate dehydrogenase [Gloeobacter kilaueensis JS1]